MRNVSSPVIPNSTVNCTEKNSPRPHTQERATEFPQSREFSKRKGREEGGFDMTVTEPSDKRRLLQPQWFRKGSSNDL
jgi:hypothetical protein